MTVTLINNLIWFKILDLLAKCRDVTEVIGDFAKVIRDML